MKERKQSQALARLCMAGMMTALVFIGNYLRIILPISVGGQTAFTLANILCVLCGILLGPWWGFAASGLGSALYDLLNPKYAPEAVLTFFVKGVYGLVTGLVLYHVFGRLLRRERDEYLPQLLSALCAALAFAAAYFAKNYFYNAMFVEGYTSPAQCWAVVLSKVPATVFNAAVAVIFAPLLGTAVQKALRAAGLTAFLEKKEAKER